MQDELFWLSATELLRHYRRRELSPVEVIRTVLARTERLEPQLNAFALLDAQAALAAARESEARWRRNVPLGLLDGVPLSDVGQFVLEHGLWSQGQSANRQQISPRGFEHHFI